MPKSDLQRDRKQRIDVLLELLKIPGTSGQEAKVSEFIQQKLIDAGLDARHIRSDGAHRKTPLRGNTGNLIAKLPGTIRGPRRMLVSHMDTVPVCVGSAPVVKGKQVRSSDPRKAIGADNRAGVAVTLLTALTLLQEDLPHPPLTFLWTIQEEIGLQGARLVSQSSLGNPKLVFNWDGGSANKMTIGATGGYRMSIDIHGKGSHAGGAPEKGISAIAVASLAIADLHRNGWHGDIRKSGKLGTSNIGIIQGGNATNVVAERVSIKAEARSHDKRFRERIVKEIEKAFKSAISKVKNIDGKRATLEFDGRLDYEAFCLNSKEPCVTAVTSAIRKTGGEPELAIANGGLDANWLTQRGMPTVSMGCGQLHQHTTDEALELVEFEKAYQIAMCLATASEAG